jgi:hypothetical protein
MQNFYTVFKFKNAHLLDMCRWLNNVSKDTGESGCACLKISIIFFLFILNFSRTSLKDLLQDSCFLTYLLTIHTAQYFSKSFEISSIY